MSWALQPIRLIKMLAHACQMHVLRDGYPRHLLQARTHACFMAPAGAVWALHIEW